MKGYVMVCEHNNVEKTEGKQGEHYRCVSCNINLYDGFYVWEQLSEKDREIVDLIKYQGDCVKEIMQLRSRLARYEFPAPYRYENCPDCKGKGKYYDDFIDGKKPPICQRCEGKGYITIQ